MVAIYKPRENNFNKLFSEIRKEFLKLDPVSFTETHLKIDGAEPYKVSGNGWKFMADIFRYIGTKAVQQDGRPVVILKGRQVGATMMAGAMDLYFTASGLYGTNNAPMRILHCFPQLGHVKRFSQDKLEVLIRTSSDDFINRQKLGYNPRTKRVSDSKIADNITLKQFTGGCNLWIESLGDDADRIRGMTVDGIFFDECFPGNQYIETENGKVTIGKLYRLFKSNKKLPLIKSFNEQTEEFEYKKVTNAWNRGKRKLIKLNLGSRSVKCTPNHLFLTNNGWIAAEHLKVGDLIKSSICTKTRISALNDDQYQVMLGSFLGDGSIVKHGNSKYRLKIRHGISQSEYCNWKADLFKRNTKQILNNGYSKKSAVEFSTTLFGIDQEFSAKKKTCPQWIVDRIDARGIAIWFMDDGSIIKKWNGSAVACLSTCSFDEASQVRFVNKFKSLGIDCHYSLHNASNGKQYYSIYFNKKGFEGLCKLISPYVHTSMEYKVLNDSSQKYIWSNEYKKYGFVSVDSICDVKDYENVFDIEIESNHNFVLSPSKSSKNLGGPIAHNCQDMEKTAIGNATKILTAARYGPRGIGVQVYFGTPKEKGSYFDRGLWEQSTKQYYHLGCEQCSNYFPLYTPGTDQWETEIWVSEFTVKCPKCGKLQDKREAIERGKWIETEPFNHDGTPKQYVGFHINQLYIPYFKKENILRLMPKHNESQSERVFANEVLGEFYSGSGMPITKEEIYEKCRDADRYFARQIMQNERKAWLGLDWGGKIDQDNSGTGQSYSCAVILSANANGIIDVEFAYKLKSQDFQYKIALVHELYKKYNVRLAVADFFYGQDVVGELQKVYGDRFLGCHAQGTMKANVTYDKEQLLLKWSKDFYIEELYDLMRRGKIRFPWKSYEQMSWLIDHITSMESKQTLVNGIMKKKYDKGIGPNDGFMALIHAYLAYKYEISRGFSVNLNNPKQTAVSMLPVLAFAPRLK